jgi:hypothetical protein
MVTPADSSADSKRSIGSYKLGTQGGRGRIAASMCFSAPPPDLKKSLLSIIQRPFAQSSTIPGSP